MQTPLQQPDSYLEQVSFLGQAPLNAIREGISVLQLNVEGLTKAKGNIIEHLLQIYKVTAVLLQETHTSEVIGTSRLSLSLTHTWFKITE